MRENNRSTWKFETAEYISYVKHIRVLGSSYTICVVVFFKDQNYAPKYQNYGEERIIRSADDLHVLVVSIIMTNGLRSSIYDTASDVYGHQQKNTEAGIVAHSQRRVAVPWKADLRIVVHHSQACEEQKSVDYSEVWSDRNTHFEINTTTLPG